MHSKRIKKKVKEDYNTIAKEFSKTRRFPWKDFDCFLPFYKGNAKVLDLGCGNGRLLTFIKKHGCKSYLGVDQSVALLEHARELHPEYEFKEMDISEMKLLKGDFDALFAIASFHHIPPELQLSALKQWKAKMKPGSYLFMTNWNMFQKRFFWSAVVSHLSFFSKTRAAVMVPWSGRLNRYYFAFTKGRIESLIREAGFKLVRHDLVNKGEPASLWTAKNILTIAIVEDSKCKN
jgi:SAM-dependent methyltransferase